MSDSPLAAPIDRVAERFWSKVEKTGSCWPWTGFCDRKGYGQFSPKSGVTKKAHRYAYELLVGPIPEGLQLDHLCRVRNCVNPDHLEPVTNRENTLRSPRVHKERCANGHEMTQENTYLHGEHRYCRICRRDADRRRNPRGPRRRAA